MDRGDRHRGKRLYKSGAEKRKASQEKEKKREELIAKTRRMTDFLQLQPNVTSTCSSSSKENVNIDDSIEHVEKGSGQQETSQNVGEETSATQPDLSSTKIDFEGENTSGYSYDIGLWPEDMSKFIDYWAKTGNEMLKNCNEELFRKNISSDDDSEHSLGIRRCTTSMFNRKTRNGEIINRSWLCFSPAKRRVYCFVCKLMSPNRTQFSQDGFCDWKHASTRLMDHETSKPHLSAVVSLGLRSKEMGRIDCDLAKQADKIKNYWRSLLKRLVSIIKFICERGLALRGDNELIGSPYNGNYLGIIELIAEYDNFLGEHIKKHGNSGSGHVSYLSSTICEEIINLMGKHVREDIISRIKKSKYFSISLDSTSDEGHVDQLTLTFRYMEHHIPIERFLKFMPNQGHKSQDIFDGLMEFLNAHGIDIKNCRGQSYDNASVMSGKYNGVQAKVNAINSSALWIPCAAHSLNLVAKAAAECCFFAINFFDFLEELYVFFTISTQRYDLLTERLKSSHSSENRSRVLVPKRVTTTRWSCRSDACKALESSYQQIKDTLATISNDTDQPSKVRCDANGLYVRMCMLEIGIYTVFWNDILERTHATSCLLQDAKLDINTATAAVKSLRAYIISRRDNFPTYELGGAQKAGTADYDVSHRKRQRNVRLIPLDYGKAVEAELSPSDKFKIENFLPVVDMFTTSLTQRLSAYEVVSGRFGFLRHLETLSKEEIENNAKKLVKEYSNDLDDTFGNELIQFIEFFKVFKEDHSTEELKELSMECFMYKILIEKGVKDAFPNVEIALRIYLVLMVTNCSSERSFSKLKLLKNRLRTTMNQDRLNNLAIMNIETDVLRQIDFNDVITSFAQEKARKTVTQ